MNGFSKAFVIVVVATGLLTAGCLTSPSTPPSAHDVDTSLNGVWSREDGEIVVTFTDSNGVFTQINSNSGWRQVQNNGAIKIGDAKFRNITMTDNLRWTCQNLTYNTRDYSMSWIKCTITMDANGQTIRTFSEGSSIENSSNTYTRVQ